MAKEIIWSRKAQKERKEILEFWIKNNGNKKYSRELNVLFQETVRIISIFPKIGKPTSDNKVRVKVIKEYLLFYEVKKTKLFILTVWDTRRDSKKIKIR